METMEASLHFCDGPIDQQALAASLPSGQAGAVVTFAGVVRDLEDGVPLRAIDYEAYEPMARAALDELLRDASARWPLLRAVIAHRTGVVPVGEASVWIGVATPHRAEAFDAARFLIDGLKSRAAIWKRAHLPANAATHEGGRT
jgi:molybdopterin synthase catalytic subunit